MSGLVRRTMGFLLVWTALNVVFNLRYPALEAWWAPFLPSLDATLILATCAVWAHAGRRVPAALTAAVGAVAVAVRVFRIADGITVRYFNRPLDLAADFGTAPELPRLLKSTLPRVTVIAGAVALCLVLVGIGVLVAGILRRGGRPDGGHLGVRSAGRTRASHRRVRRQRRARRRSSGAQLQGARAAPRR